MVESKHAKSQRNSEKINLCAQEQVPAPEVAEGGIVDEKKALLNRTGQLLTSNLTSNRGGETEFIKKALKEEVPFLGVCLGSQLLAKACGAQVTKSPVKEVGWFKVKLENLAKQDVLFKGFEGEMDVYHWHEDMFAIPQNGVRLATAQGCPNQAFRVGKHGYGIQFHIEVTEPIITDWCRNYLKSNDPQLQKKAKDMIETYRKKKGRFNKTAEKIYRNFEEIILKVRGS